MARIDMTPGWDRRLGIQTAGREDERGARFMPYEPTPYPVLERLLQSGWINQSDRVMDVGCGKGRAAIFLAHGVPCRVTGIDYSEKLVRMAEENRLACPCPDRLAFTASDARSLDPAGHNVFFFFNPFSADVLGVVLRRVLSRAETGASYRFIFYFPTEEYMAAAREVGLEQTGEISCRDLFGPDPRERLVLMADMARRF